MSCQSHDTLCPIAEAQRSQMASPVIARPGGFTKFSAGEIRENDRRRMCPIELNNEGRGKCSEGESLNVAQSRLMFIKWFGEVSCLKIFTIIFFIL